jgi:hypothetical protein
MTIGIGGAGSKLAIQLDPEATIVNVSETELNKLDAGSRILAVVHAAHGQLRGSRKSPQIGRDAYLSIKRELLHLIPGNLILSSTGGGTGNGITASILEELAARDDVPAGERSVFVLVLPYARLEPAEFVVNTIGFLQQPLSEAIDSGNTGNIFLVSNKVKFESRFAEAAYNKLVVDSLKLFLDIPHKGERLKLLDGHVDFEDFALYVSRPYFNHFTQFDFDPEGDFAKQLTANLNPYLLPPDNPIEALFMLEVPAQGDPTVFYGILEYFAGNDVTPVYGVVENPEIETPLLTVSLLYSRKPDELVEDFNRISQEHVQAKVRKSLEQHVSLPRLEVNMQREAKRVAKQRGTGEDDVLAVLRRIGKI